MGSTTLFNAVFIRPEQVVRFLLCISTLFMTSDVRVVISDFYDSQDFV